MFPFANACSNRGSCGMKRLVALSALAFCLAGCAKKQVAKLPPVPMVPPPARTAPAPVELPAPPQVMVSAAPEPLPPMAAPIPNAPKPAIPVRPRVVQKKESLRPKPVGPGFQLGEVLTAAQVAELSSQFDSFLRAAEQTVRLASSRVLNPEQSSLLSQLRIIVDQARNARVADLVEARKLAERARNLAEALVRNGL